MNAVVLNSEKTSSDLLHTDPDAWFAAKFEEQMTVRAQQHQASMAIVVTKGTLDWAYPPFILASSAAALGWDVSLFFTFYGLSLLKKDLDLSVSPIGNPAMPMKMPLGPQWLKEVNWQIPNALMSNVPGFEGLATNMMKQTIRNKGVASIEELRTICLEMEVKMIACQMTVDLFGWNVEDFVPEVQDWVGATAFLPTAKDADVTLFV